MRHCLFHAVDTQTAVAVTIRCHETKSRLRGLIRAVARSISRVVGVPTHDELVADEADELQNALAARRLLVAFRHQIAPICDIDDVEPPDEVLTRAQLALEHLRAFATHPDRRCVWAGDRHALDDLNARFEAWSQSEHATPRGARELLGDLSVCADLLVGINQREILKQHDAKMIRAGVTSLRDAMAALSVSRVGAWERFASIIEDILDVGWRIAWLGRDLRAELASPTDDDVQIAARMTHLEATLMKLQRSGI